MNTQVLDAQIAEKQKLLDEYKQLAEAELELVRLQDAKSRLLFEENQAKKRLNLQKQIDSIVINKDVDNEVKAAVIALAETLVKWAQEKSKLSQLESLILEQVSNEFNNHSLAMSEAQLNAAKQGFGSQVVIEIAHERMLQMNASRTFDLKIESELPGQVQGWSDYLLKSIKSMFHPVSTHKAKFF